MRRLACGRTPVPQAVRNEHHLQVVRKMHGTAPLDNISIQRTVSLGKGVSGLRRAPSHHGFREYLHDSRHDSFLFQEGSLA